MNDMIPVPDVKHPVPKNRSKPSTKNISTTPIRVKRETRKKIISELARINKKDNGRKLHVDDLISLAISLVEDHHVKSLQASSLSNTDRFEIQYKAYLKQHGSISKDDYLGRLMNGELHTSSADDTNQSRG